MKFLQWVGLTLCLLVGLATFQVSLAEEVPELGLKTLEGQPASLKEYVGKGKWTLVMFWATNCPICEQNKPQISAFHQEHADKDAEVVGIAIDGMAARDKIKAVLDQQPVSFPNYVGELALLAINFQIAAGEPLRGTPTYWFFNPQGELLAVNPGPVRKEAIEVYMARRAQTGG